MRATLLALPLILSMGAFAVAEDVTTTGQPICRDKEELQEAVLALIKKDLQWIKSLKSCIIAKGGMKIVTIEEFGNNDAIKVAKVRVFGFGTSMVGYTLNVSE